MAWALPLTLAQLAAAPDTAVVRLLPAPVSAFDRVLGIAEIGAVALAYALILAVIFAALRARKSFDDARASLDEVGRDLKQLADNANRISASVTAMASSIERDVAAVHETVEYANERARTAVTKLADRVDRFNDTIGVVQSDTEDVVFGALAAFKGVRAGLEAMKGGGRKRRRRERERADDLDRDESDRASSPALPPDLPARPRLKRRAPGRG